MNRQEWTEHLKPYSNPDYKKAAWQLVNTFIPYIVFLSLSVYLVAEGGAPLLAAGAMIVAGAMLVRLFILFHDCTHESFVKSKKWNKRIGIVLGIFTFTPFMSWKKEHGIHHGTVGNLGKRGTGDIWTLTVREYQSSSLFTKAIYRIYRHPLLLFVIAPLFLFGLMNRIPSKTAGKKEKVNTWLTNGGILIIALVFSAIFTPGAYLVAQAITLTIAGSMGIWLFYIQHQFEEVYWADTQAWNSIDAALKGSTFYKLPLVLEWVSGYIGYHHIHHLNPNIPNYNLKACYEASTPLKQVKTVTLGSSFHLAWLNFYDEKKQQLITYRQMRLTYF